MESRGVEEDHLTSFDMFNAENPVSGGLGFFSDDGNLFAKQTIEQGGLAHIGATNNGNSSKLHGFEEASDFLSGSGTN